MTAWKKGAILVILVLVLISSGCISLLEPSFGVICPTGEKVSDPNLCPKTTSAPPTTTLAPTTTASVTSPTQTSPAPVIPKYEIVTQDDLSFALVKRLRFFVVVPSTITVQGVKDVAQAVVDEVIKTQKVNAINIRMVDQLIDVGDIYTIAAVDWVPNGEWVDADTVEAGDYSKHDFSYNIREKVTMDIERPTDREFEIYTKFHAALYEDPDVPEEVVTRRIARQFSITEEELTKIYTKVLEWKFK